MKGRKKERRDEWEGRREEERSEGLSERERGGKGWGGTFSLCEQRSPAHPTTPPTTPERAAGSILHDCWRIYPDQLAFS